MRPSQKHADTGRQDEKDIVQLKDSDLVAYNPDLLAQLELCRVDLKQEYVTLLEALENSQLLKIRYIFIQFYKTLLRYISQNRIELYGYLGKLHEDDSEYITVINTNKLALNTEIDTITRTLASYISPSAKYDEKFRIELGAIWAILKERHKQEKKQLYPLYPGMLIKEKSQSNGS